MSKWERDVAGAAGVLAELFGFDEASDVADWAKEKIGASEAAIPKEPKSSGAVTLDPCAKCGVYVLPGNSHACASDLGERLAEEPKGETVPPVVGKAGRIFYCAFGPSGKFLGAFASPYQALDAAGDEGFTKRLHAADLPED